MSKSHPYTILVDDKEKTLKSVDIDWDLDKISNFTATIHDGPDVSLRSTPVEIRRDGA